MNEKLNEFFQRILKSELAWMYHFSPEDESFGVQTDRYSWTKNVLEGKVTVNEFLDYFIKYYPNDEKLLIEAVKELM